MPLSENAGDIRAVFEASLIYVFLWPKLNWVKLESDEYKVINPIPRRKLALLWWREPESHLDLHSVRTPYKERPGDNSVSRLDSQDRNDSASFRQRLGQLDASYQVTGAGRAQEETVVHNEMARHGNGLLIRDSVSIIDQFAADVEVPREL
jgi:hypothetical protein